MPMVNYVFEIFELKVKKFLKVLTSLILKVGHFLPRTLGVYSEHPT